MTDKSSLSSKRDSKYGLDHLLGKPIILQFSYLHDCQVKTPVLFKERVDNFYLKHPVKPPENWKLNVIIRSIQFPCEYQVRLMKSPFGETEYWDTTVISQVGQSEFAEIYQISKPLYHKFRDNERKHKRFFCLVPAKCFVKNQAEPIQATCIDVSDLGGGLRFNHEIPIQIGDPISIKFEDYLSKIPLIKGKVVRKSADPDNNYVSVGFVTMQESLETMKKLTKLVLEKNSQPKTNQSNNRWLPPDNKDAFSKISKSLGKFFEF